MSQQTQCWVFCSLSIFPPPQASLFISSSFSSCLISFSSFTSAYLPLGLCTHKWPERSKQKWPQETISSIHSCCRWANQGPERIWVHPQPTTTTTTTPPRWLQTRTRASFPVKFPFHSASGGHLIPECPKPCIEVKCHFLISQSAFRKQMRQGLFFHLGVYVRSNALCFWNSSSRCVESDKSDAHHRRGSVRSCLYVWGCVWLGSHRTFHLRGSTSRTSLPSSLLSTKAWLLYLESSSWKLWNKTKF